MTLDPQPFGQVPGLKSTMSEVTHLPLAEDGTLRLGKAPLSGVWSPGAQLSGLEKMPKDPTPKEHGYRKGSKGDIRVSSKNLLPPLRNRPVNKPGQIGGELGAELVTMSFPLGSTKFRSCFRAQSAALQLRRGHFRKNSELLVLEKLDTLP